MLNNKNLDIYFSRLVSALCLFWILAEANVWLDPLNNVVLVLGYRLFILFTPIFFSFFKHRLTFVAIAMLEMGLVLWLLQFTMLGTIFFALGIAVSGYMLKYYSAFSAKGAAGNKIAINLGSIFSGGLAVLSQNKMITLPCCFVLMLISLLSFSKYFTRENIANFPSAQSHFKLNIFSKLGFAWAIVGFVIGVKLIAIVSILPQFLLLSNNILPAWFGLMFVVNSVLVVVLQMPIMNRIKHVDKITAILPLFIGMLIIALSAQLQIATFVGAFVWIFALTLVECTISYLDKLSQDDHCLLIKEAFVGVGCATTVYLVRFLPPAVGSFYIGVISILLLLVSLGIFYFSKEKLEPSKNSLHSPNLNCDGVS